MKKPYSLKVLSIGLLAAGLILSGCGPSGNSSSSRQSSASSSGNATSNSSKSSAGSSSSATSSGASSSSSSGNSSSSSSSLEVKVTLSGDATVVMGKTIALTASVANASDTSVTWASSDDAIATVADGVVTGVNPGSATITVTAVADPSKSAALSITVADKYAFRISANGEYDVEAEALDFSNATLRSDLSGGFVESPSGDAAAVTSGGKSIRGVVAPSTFDIAFYAAKASVLDLKGRFAYYDAGFVLDDNVTFSLDGASLGKSGAVFGGHSSAGDFWPWQDIEIAKTLVLAGEHTLHIAVTVALPNADVFKFIASDYDNTSKYYVVSGNGATTAEAEALDLSDLVIRSDLASAGRTKESLVETATDASNGKSIGGIGACTVLTVNLYFEDEAVVDVVARMADYDDVYDVDAKLSFKMDDAVLTSNGYKAFGHTDANQYWNWKNVDLGKATIKKGFHAFTYTAIGDGINLDCFTFTSAYYGNVSAAGVQLMANGITTVEAESLQATTGSYTSEAPSGTAANLTSGGLSIGNVAVGTVFTIPFFLGNKATVKIVARMAKTEADFNLDANVTIQLDGTTLTTGFAGFGSDGDNLYWNWKDITLQRSLLAAGSHTLTLTATAGFPNMDCLSFAVTGYGDDFSALAANGTYTIEGESLDITHLVTDGSGHSLIESDPRDSNGESLGHLSGGYFEIPFYLEGLSTVGVTCVISKYEPLVIGTSYSLYLDGGPLAFIDPAKTLGRAEDGSNDWYNWKDCQVQALALAKGEHVFKFALNAAVNVDCVKFAVAPGAAD